MTRTDDQLIVSDSKNYLYAAFSFSEEWHGLIKTAQFTKLSRTKTKNPTYNVVIANDKCLVPWEVLTGPGIVRVHVFAGDRITTAPDEFNVLQSGITDGQLPNEPTPDYFKQVVEYLATDFKGDKGDKGEQGIQGPQGEPGEITEAEMLAVTGDQTYTEQNYVTNGESLTESIDALDVSLNAAFDAIDAANIPTPMIWTTVTTFSNSWFDTFPSTGPVQYSKDAFGIVRLRGCIRGGLNNTIAFILPEEYRPSRLCMFSSVTYNSVTVFNYAIVFINEDGEVKIAKKTSDEWDYTPLDCCQFTTN